MSELSAVANPTESNYERVSVEYEHSPQLAPLLQGLGISLIISTYQAGRVATIGTDGNEVTVRFAHFRKAMGIARTATGLAIGSKTDIWSLPASIEIAKQIQPTNTHDIAFLARQSHVSGLIMGHEICSSANQLWVVNTAFNCLCTIEAPYNFVPRWKPPFISELAPGDRCHLNGLCLSESDGKPAFVTVLAETDTINGWRENKRQSGALLEVGSGTAILRGLCMPHSPRSYKDQLYVLNSGLGTLDVVDQARGTHQPLAAMPGFTRGLDHYGGYAFVGLSKIRETAVFGELPISEQNQSLHCGVAVVDCQSGNIVAHIFFNSGVDEIFAVTVLPGYTNPVVIGPQTEIDNTETIWMAPPLRGDPSSD